MKTNYRTTREWRSRTRATDTVVRIADNVLHSGPIRVTRTPLLTELDFSLHSPTGTTFFGDSALRLVCTRRLEHLAVERGRDRVGQSFEVHGVVAVVRH